MIGLFLLLSSLGCCIDRVQKTVFLKPNPPVLLGFGLNCFFSDFFIWTAVRKLVG